MEPILTETKRHAAIPRDPKYSAIWDNYLEQQAGFWTASKINFTNDEKNFKNVPDNIKLMIDHVLGFFSIGDELINENLDTNFIDEITIPEIKVTLRYQTMSEDIHSQVYNENILAIYPLKKDRDRIFNMVKSSPFIERKKEFAKKYMDRKTISFNERIIAFTAYEGIAFSGSFAFIDWLKEQGYDLEGMYSHNEYISNDESNHTKSGAIINSYLVEQASDEKIKQIIDELMQIEYDLWDSIIPYDTFGNLSRRDMRKHIFHCGNIVTRMLGRSNIYNRDTTSPFKFLGKRSLATKANFFEKESINYRMSSDVSVPITAASFDTSDDF